eukprot:Rhum_TRINITY_DN19364_c0_g1::Rhum_TRINITY_DN19364_c0_g1_i1::g.169889::m.169889
MARRVTEVPGKEYCMRDVLEGWGITDQRWKNMSRKWRCKVVPFSDTETAIMRNLIDESPSVAQERYVSEVHKACGEDGLSTMLAGKGNDLPRPKLAFNSSWGVPGAELIDEKHLTIVHKLSEVFDHPQDKTPRNLQMFHRDTPDEPQIPILPSLFSWPDFLESTTVKCDKATRFSQKDALTTWHLDDCGEFVYQTALSSPLPKDAETPCLVGYNGKKVVKIFFCSPKWGYDFITQDQEQNRSGKFAQMDIWSAPDEWLPEADRLPVINLCLIEAGGRPLLMFPNVPHTVLTVDDSVLVEERRVSILFLDEVAYFVRRSRQSTAPPIFYDFVTNTCTDAAALREQVITPLFTILRDADAPQVGGESAELRKCVRRRAVASLRAIVKYDDVFYADAADRASIGTALKQFAPEESASELGDEISQENERLTTAVPLMPYGVLQHGRTGEHYAYTHVDGRPVFGPPRVTLAAARSDHKTLVSFLDFVSDQQSPEVAKALAAVAAVKEETEVPQAKVTTQDKALLDELF